MNRMRNRKELQWGRYHNNGDKPFNINDENNYYKKVGNNNRDDWVAITMIRS